MPANYVLLQRIELNASAASVSFTNIPQSGYTDLKMVMSARSDGADWDSVSIRFNNDSNSGRYTSRALRGNGSTVISFVGGNTTASYISEGNGTNSTSNTFTNSEVYIPNYTASIQKSISVDAVGENNATAGYQVLSAGLYNQTTSISSITLQWGSGYNFVSGSTFSLYGLAAVGTTPVIAPKATGGNLVYNDGTNWIHIFNSTGVFTPQTGLSCDYLVVAGGAGGGYAQGGGGGAGGLRSTVTATGGGGSLESKLSVAPGTSYTIQVGAGGAGGVTSVGTNGGNSIFSTITATGGGGGGSLGAPKAGQNGGSGGGGGADTTTKGTGTTNQGYDGGTGRAASPSGGAGGGGAGAVGTDSPATSSSANGGNGVATSISGSSVTYAGGGGGGGNIYNRNVTSSGGTGGGGGSTPDGAGTAGTVNTGGGGGGGGQGNTLWTGGAGGSGIVIIRYPIA